MIKITNIQAARTIGVLLILLSDNSFADSTTSKSTYDWTGVYVGGFVGGASSAKTTTTEPYGGTLPSHYWNAPYGNTYSYDTNASFIGGGTVGYNWQIGKTPYLIGLEGEYGYLDMSGSSNDPNSALYNSSKRGTAVNSTNVGGSYGYGLVGGRIGYAKDRSLFYVKSGAVFTNTQTNYTDLVWLKTSGHSNSPGYALGAGIEYALPPEWFQLAKNISIKTEYLYFGIARTQETSGYCIENTPFSSADKISGIHTAKIGVNYKF